MLAEWEEVPSITCREHVDSSFDRTGEDGVVGRVAGDRLYRSRWPGSERGNAGEQRGGGASVLLVEAELRRQHTLQLVADEVG